MMGGMAFVLTITEYLADGSAANRHWEISQRAAEELVAQLGPGGESLQTAAELEAMSAHMSTPVVDWSTTA